MSTSICQLLNTRFSNQAFYTLALFNWLCSEAPGTAPKFHAPRNPVVSAQFQGDREVETMKRKGLNRRAWTRGRRSWDWLARVLVVLWVTRALLEIGVSPARRSISIFGGCNESDRNPSVI